MFRFEHIEHLYVLGILPALILFFWLTWLARKQALLRFGNKELVEQLMPAFSRYKHYLKFSLLIAALALLIVGWANPQFGSKLATVKRKSVDVIIALDLSQSMAAQDIAPSRLDRARRFAQNLVDGLKGERLGLIVFAGSAFLQSPVTTDYGIIDLSLRSASPEILPDQGTNIGEAIELARRSYDEKNQSHKALVIISDGEEHEENALKQAQEAQNEGVLIFAVGVGTEEGGFVPVSENGRENYKRDQTGNPVVSKLNEEVLRGIAKEANGQYFNLNSNSQVVLNALKEGISQMEKQELEERIFTEYQSHFQWFIGLGLLLLLIEFMIPYRKSRLSTGKGLFDRW
ncbi:MAG TPA: VWA domain-containing protein [Saprospiraceae bacterium]|nr:VWA domain-containing protein [Saprospiraceae bacterium]HMQ81993.1 VWA domain-containing protein [Saprospiraceae bacterium]